MQQPLVNPTPPPGGAQLRAMENQPLLGGTTNTNIAEYGPVHFERRNSDLDDQFMGQKMPKRLGRGPVPMRSITDVLCCVCFLVFFLVWVVIGVLYAFKGSVKDANNLMDSEGNQCGVDEKVKSYPYLYMIKFDANYKSYCVRECPKFDYNQIKYNSDGSTPNAVPKPLYFEDYGSVVDYSLRNRLAQEPNTKQNAFDYDPAFAAGYFTKDQYYNYLKRTTTQCFTNADLNTCGHDPAQGIWLYDSRPSDTTGFCVPINSEMAEVTTKFSRLSGDWTKDFGIAKWMFLISIATAFVVALLFLFLSAKLMSLLIWLQIALAIFFTGALAVVFWLMAFADHSQMLKNNQADEATIRAYNNLKRFKWWMFVFALIFTFLCLFLIIYVALNVRKIMSCIHILKVLYFFNLVRQHAYAQKPNVVPHSSDDIHNTNNTTARGTVLHLQLLLRRRTRQG
jgi:hypothetical protein